MPPSQQPQPSQLMPSHTSAMRPAQTQPGPVTPDVDPDITGLHMVSYLAELEKLPDGGGFDPPSLAFAKFFAHQLGSFYPVTARIFTETAMGVIELTKAVDPTKEPNSPYAPYHAMVLSMPSTQPLLMSLLSLANEAYGDELGAEVMAFYDQTIKRLHRFEAPPAQATGPTPQPTQAIPSPPVPDVQPTPVVINPQPPQPANPAPEADSTDDEGVLRIRR